MLYGPVLLGFAGRRARDRGDQATRRRPRSSLAMRRSSSTAARRERRADRGPICTRSPRSSMRAITGSDPPPAADRLTEDRIRPLVDRRRRPLQPSGFSAAIDAAMTVQPRRRPADHAEFRALMGDIEAPERSRSHRLPTRYRSRSRGPAGGWTARSPRPLPPPPAVAPGVPATPAAEPKPHAAKSAPAAALDEAGERAAPSWMQAAQTPGIGKRALYGARRGRSR